MKTDWVVVYDGVARKDRKPYEMECLRCGERYAPAIPASVTVWVATAKAFTSEHRGCKQHEPEVAF